MSRSRALKLLLATAFALLATAPTVASAATIHSEKSMYRNIVVREYSGRRCLLFTVVRGDKNQSCIDLSDPKKLVFSYTQMVFAGLLVNPAPKSILVMGLGGGSIPATLHELLPDATVEAVEIDEAVVRVARKYFDFQEDERMHVDVHDARVFVKRAGVEGRKFDLIVLDAFTGEYIPEHLMTVEFLEEVKAILSDEGVLVANTFSNSNLYHHESVTYRQVYGPFFNFKLRETGNRVIIAATHPLPSLETLEERAQALAASLAPFGIEITRYPSHLSLDADWDEEKRPLTDQYSPANLLRERSR